MTDDLTVIVIDDGDDNAFLGSRWLFGNWVVILADQLVAHDNAVNGIDDGNVLASANRFVNYVVDVLIDTRADAGVGRNVIGMLIVVTDEVVADDIAVGIDDWNDVAMPWSRRLFVVIADEVMADDMVVGVDNGDDGALTCGLVRVSMVVVFVLFLMVVGVRSPGRSSVWSPGGSSVRSPSRSSISVGVI